MYTGYSRGLVKIKSIAFDVPEMIVVTPALQSPAGVAVAFEKMRNTQLTLRTLRQDREQSTGSKAP